MTTGFDEIYLIAIDFELFGLRDNIVFEGGVFDKAGFVETKVTVVMGFDGFLDSLMLSFLVTGFAKTGFVDFDFKVASR